MHVTDICFVFKFLPEFPVKTDQKSLSFLLPSHPLYLSSFSPRDIFSTPLLPLQSLSSPLSSPAGVCVPRCIAIRPLPLLMVELQ